MKKHWIKIYLLFSSIVCFFVCLICSLSFFNLSISSEKTKYNFESIYQNTTIDFVIPAPSFEQTANLDNKSEYGIKYVTPYYSTSTNLTINNKSEKANVLIFDDANKIEQTPYCKKRLLSGSHSKEESFAIAGKDFCKKYECNAGNTVSLTIDNVVITCKISGMAEKNTLMNNPAIALFIPNSLSKQLADKKIRYSGAYVESSDQTVCYNYLCNDYKPLSRLKDISEFNGNVDAYNKHVEVFNETNWAPEITNMGANYNALKVKYDNIPNNNIRNTIISSFLFFAAVFAFNLIILLIPSEKKFFKEGIAKKAVTQKNIKSHYLFGDLFQFVITLLVFLLSNLIVVLISDSLYIFANIALYMFMPLAGMVIALLAIVIVDLIFIKKTYGK